MSMQRPNAGLRRVSAGPTPNAGYRAALDQQVSAKVMEQQPDAADGRARADLLARLQALADAVCTNYPGARLQAFGSSVSGLGSNGADLDLSLVLPGDVDIPDAAQRAMVSELAEKLEASGQYSSVFARPKARAAYISPISPLYRPYFSPISPLYLPISPYISPISPLYLAQASR